MVGEAAGYGVQKAGEAIDIARLNMEIANLNTTVNQRLQEIGETVYATHCGQLTDSDQLLEKLRRIDQLKLEIQLRRQEIARLQGKLLCPHCGKPAAEGDLFCRECGTPLN